MMTSRRGNHQEKKNNDEHNIYLMVRIFFFVRGAPGTGSKAAFAMFQQKDNAAGGTGNIRR